MLHNDILSHLTNQIVYQLLAEEEAYGLIDEVVTSINKWLFKYGKVVDSDSKHYIRHHTRLNRKKNPFGAFYLMYKVHKDPIKTRPVVSDCASITNPLAKWVCMMLKPFANSLSTNFKDSFELKKILDGVVVPPGAKLFTCDASAMYTNINTDAALSAIAKYLHDADTQLRFPLRPRSSN